MKLPLKSEEVLLFLGGIWLFSPLPYAWWIFPAVILVPDIGMPGYGLKCEKGFKFTHLGSLDPEIGNHA